jgi:hypothetical protein
MPATHRSTQRRQLWCKTVYMLSAKVPSNIFADLTCSPTHHTAPNTGSATTEAQANHGVAMEAWLGRLEKQMSASLPKARKTMIPSLNELFLWVDELVVGAEELTWADMRRMNSITHTAALQNQAAILAALTTGRYLPPIRLYIARTIIHPAFLTEGEEEEPLCQDRDCRDSSCLGNHIEVFGEHPGNYKTGTRKDLRRIK